MSLLVAFCIEILIVSAIQTVYRIANPWEMGARLLDGSLSASRTPVSRLELESPLSPLNRDGQRRRSTRSARTAP